jgi:uncharacterized membrane protein YqjE
MEDRPLSAIMKDLMQAFSGLVRSEIKLARVEMTENARVVGKSATRIGAFAVVGWLGVLCFVSFLVIGLGNLLGGRYWLSALLVSLLFLVPSAFAIMGAIRKVKTETGFDQTKYNVQADRLLINQKVQELRTAPATAGSDRLPDEQIPA